MDVCLGQISRELLLVCPFFCSRNNTYGLIVICGAVFWCCRKARGPNIHNYCTRQSYIAFFKEEVSYTKEAPQ